MNGLHVNAADMSPEVLGVDGESDLLTIPLSVWQRTLDVNLTGFLLAARRTIPHLLEADGGGITNTVSDAIYAGESVRVGYATTKTALTAVTRHIASRWGREGIRCNSISPGIIARNEEIEADMLASNHRRAALDTGGPSRRHRVDGGIPALGRRRVGERSGVERERRPLPQLTAQVRHGYARCGEGARLFGIRLEQESRLDRRRGSPRRTASR